MLKINVALPDGHAELLTLLPSSSLQELKTAAQQAFGKMHLRLITAKNRVLVNLEQTLEEAEIEDGECLTALVLQPQLAATEGAFALWCHGDSTIVTWGDEYRGGDSSAFQDQLRGVQQIQATGGAFAAILEDGSVVTWGRANEGGDSSAVQDQLRGVQQIQATLYGAFAAILADGSIVTWGDADGGGDSSAVQDQLRGVQQIQATGGAFAAFLEDGSVVTWGCANQGGDSSAVRDQLRGVQQMRATLGAFAAILADGSVVTAGDADCGGDSSAVRDQLKGVRQIQATHSAFAAILEDGLVVTWELKYTLAVTVRQFKISSRVCGRFKPQVGPLLRFWKMDLSLPVGDADDGGGLFWSSKSAEGCAADSSHGSGLCCDSGRWIHRYLG